jgi:trimeric autotransporter adhesin
MQTKHVTSKKIIYLFLALFFANSILAQSLAINTDGSTANASALLDVKSTTKGLLIPRLTNAQKLAIAAPATGLLIFQTAPDSIGFHYYDGSQWLYLLNNAADSLSWKTTGNTITDSKFIGTLNDSAIRFRINNIPSGFIDTISLSTAIGYKSLLNQDAGPLGNTAFGYKTLLANTSGYYNTAIGLNVLRDNKSGYANTGIGMEALRRNITGSSNVAIGLRALVNSKNSFYHTAIGNGALFSDTAGLYSVAIGDNALANNQRSYDNVAIGAYALNVDSSGYWNTAVGTSALRYNKSGYANVAIGNIAGLYNTTGYNNTAVGYGTLATNKTGSFNTAIGALALYFDSAGVSNTAIGTSALFNNKTGQNNVTVGAFSSQNNVSGNNNIAVGVSPLFKNKFGNDNTALGFLALSENVNSSNNIAIGTAASYNLQTSVFGATNYGSVSIGTSAMFSCKSCAANIAIGAGSLYNDTTGTDNIGIGYQALGFTSSGYANTGIGQNAGIGNKTGFGNVSLGSFSGINNVSGNTNIAIGYNAGSNLAAASNMIAIGFNAGKVGGNTNSVEIGNTSMLWIGGQIGWFNYSDERIKENINYNNVPGLAFIKKLQPATYNLNIHKQNKLLSIADSINWEGKYDIEKIQQTGFIAQQVAQAAKELNYNFSGVQAPVNGKGLYSLQYSSFVVPIVKAIKEEDERIEKLEVENKNLQKEIQDLKKIVTNLIQIQNEKK